MIIYDKIIQGSPEWFKIRKDKMTASHATAIGNAGKGLQTYVRNIIKDMIHEPENYISKDMERGNELEPIARQVYEFEKNILIQEVGFVELNKYVGCSPDGLTIMVDGGAEIKARNDEKHFGLLLGDKVDSGTIWQIQMNMLICKSKWWDFVSYNPNFKRSLFVERFYPDLIKHNQLLKGFELGEKMIKNLLENENVKFEL